MAIPDPASIYFQFIGAAGAAEIAFDRPIDSADWVDITKNDVYLWAVANRKTWWSWATHDGANESTIIVNMVTPALTTVVEAFWTLSEGRDGFQFNFDIENAQVKVSFYDSAGVFVLAASTAVIGATRTKGMVVSGSSLTDTDGHFVVEVLPSAASTDAKIYAFKAMERAILLADL